MISFFVKRPVTTIMFILLFVVLGMVSIFNLPIESTPKINFPIVSVTVNYPGATPLEIETLMIDKIEDAVSELAAIEEINSYAYEGYGFVMIEFNLTSDVNTKFIEVKDKVEGSANDLPTDAEKPVVEKVDPLMTPVMNLVLLSDTVSSRDLYEYADKKLKNEFSKVSGVASIDIIGGQERQINVHLDPMKMKQYYVDITDVVKRINLMNRNIPGGSIEKKNSEISVRFLGEFVTIEDIRNLVIVSGDGDQLQLKDIAMVVDGAKDVSSIARLNGKNGVGLAVNKVSDGFAVDIAKRIRKRLPQIKETLPEGVDIEIAADTTDFIVSETVDAGFNILLGIFLTVAVLYLFTGRAKLTLIGSVIIPTSLISTVFLMDQFGFSINMMTLLGIATSMGTLIANAIVIIESVLAHLEHGKTPRQAAIDGTEEVATAILASTGTNLVVFIPIAFMGGIVGQFFKSFGLTVVFATIFSLIASFSLTPMMCGMLLSENDAVDSQRKSFNPFYWLHVLTDKIFNFIAHEYTKCYKFMFRHKIMTMIAILVTFVMAFKSIMPFIDGEFYPASDHDEVVVQLNMPQGTRIERTQKVVESIEEYVAQIPEVVSYFSNIGNQGKENAVIILTLTKSAERERSDKDIINQLLPFTATIPDAEIFLVRGGGVGNSTEGDVSVAIYGTDFNVLERLADELKEKMEQTGFFRSVVSSYKTPKKEVQFIPNQENMTFYDLDNSDIGVVLRSSLYGDESNVFKELGNEYDISVDLRDEYKSDIEEIEQIGVITRKGMIPIIDLGNLVRTSAVPPIRHQDRSRVIRLEGFLSKGALSSVRQLLIEKFGEVDFPEGHGYKFAGDADRQDDTNKEIFKAFFLAVVLTVMLLCAVLDSLIYPIPSLLLILLSYLGAFFALFFLGESMNLASMLGLIMLVGLVVNDAILVLDHALMLIKRGVAPDEAIFKGTMEKFRAIILTTICVVLGALPQLRSVMPLKTSMGTVIIGGMLGAAFYTFVFIPIGFSWAHSLVLMLSKKNK